MIRNQNLSNHIYNYLIRTNQFLMWNSLNITPAGIRMGSLGLFLQCATSTFFSLVMSRLVCLFGSRTVYLSSMVCFTISALVICLSKSVLLVTAMSALTGFAYATLQTLPYTLTCHYHKEKEVGISYLHIFSVFSSMENCIIYIDSIFFRIKKKKWNLNSFFRKENIVKYITKPELELAETKKARNKLKS